MPREKIKFALRMAPETQELVKEMCLRDNCRTQNEFIEKAVRDTENRICRLLFKQAVELDMIMNVLAAGMEIDGEQLNSLRGRCVQNVKKTNGSVTLEDAVQYQKGGE